MLKSIRTFFLSLGLSLVSFVGFSQENQDDLYKYEALDNKLDEYFEAIKQQSFQVKMEECDFLISSVEDSLMRQHVALYCYAHYMDSRLMGDEAVSIHLTDKWFEPGIIKMEDDFDLINARIFADFNRRSLLGCSAPELRVETFDGDSTSLFTGGKKRLSVLYFYDTSCSRCKLETPVLCHALDNVDFPIDVYAVYVGASKEAWADYIEKFKTTSTEAKIYHLWDSSRDSDFERKYGVLQTPRMYLIDRSNTIIGRGLYTDALVQMLDKEFVSRTYEYGSDTSEQMFDAIFEGDNGSTVMAVADHLAEGTMALGDTVSFKKMAGDLLYYLSSQRGEQYKLSTDKFLKKYITSDNGIWLDQWDSLKVVGLGQMMESLLSKSPIGEKIEPIKVPGTHYCHEMKAWRNRKMKLTKLKSERNYIIFHSEGCSVCKAEIEKALPLLQSNSTKKLSIFQINVDRIAQENEELASKLLDTFDLSAMPFILETDKKGIIRRKYVSFLDDNNNN